MKKNWAIRNAHENDLFWSNDWGWGSREGCDIFTRDEKEFLNLPIEGEWVQVVVGKFTFTIHDVRKGLASIRDKLYCLRCGASVILVSKPNWVVVCPKCGEKNA